MSLYAKTAIPRSRLKRKRKFWYFVTFCCCIVCGGKEGESYRERRYGRKPKLWKNRHAIDSTYCGCEDHQFL